METATNVDLEDTESLLQKGIAGARSGDRERAYVLLRAVLRRNPRNQEALLWLAWVVADPSVSIMYLEQLLSINPDSEAGKKGLEWARARQLQRNRENGRAIYEPVPTKPAAPVLTVMEPAAPRESEQRTMLEVPISALSGPVGITRSTSKARLVAAAIAVLLVGFSIYSVLLTNPSPPQTLGSTELVTAMDSPVPVASSRDFSSRGSVADTPSERYSVTTIATTDLTPFPSATATAEAPVQYVVEQGDSLWKIAEQYSVTIDQIMELNKLQSSDLSIGQVLLIPSD
jgi:LysM repeat protein